MAKATPQTTKERIAKFVRENPGYRTCDIGRRVGIKPSTVNTSLSALQREGRITKKGKLGAYQYYPAMTPPVKTEFGVSAGMQLLNNLLAAVRV